MRWLLPLLLLALPALAATTGWSLQAPPASPPLAEVRLWAPSGTETPRDLVVLLHGSQPAGADPTWMAWLRVRPPFRERLLLVPSIPEARDWDAPATLDALRALVTAAASPWSIPRERTFLVGFSTGASEGFAVAAALRDQVGAYAAFAGLPPADLGPADLGRLSGTRILLACMEYDEAVPCNAGPTHRDRLRIGGVRSVDLAMVKGRGHDGDLDALAPVLAKWMDER